MRRIVVLLTNAMFAGHVLLGCCWHHAHGEAVADEPRHAECCHHACAHHELPVTAQSAEDHEHEPADRESPATPCDQGRCQFVKCEMQRIDLTAGICWIPLATAADAMPSNEVDLNAHLLSFAARPLQCPLHMLFCTLQV